MGKGFKKALKGLGKVVGGGLKIAAPFAGLIPGVGIPLSIALGAGGRALGRTLSGQNTFGRGGLKEIALSGAGAGAGAAALGGQGFRGIGNIGANLKNIGRSGIFKTIGKQFQTPTGELDLGRVAGAGMGAANFFGGRAQRKQQERYSNAQTDLRNQLMSRILQSPQYASGQ